MKALILFNSMTAERSEEAAEEHLKLAEVDLWCLRKEASSLHQMQSEAASADTEAVASYPDIAKMMKAATLKKSNS